MLLQTSSFTQCQGDHREQPFLRQHTVLGEMEGRLGRGRTAHALRVFLRAFFLTVIGSQVKQLNSVELELNRACLT